MCFAPETDFSTLHGCMFIQVEFELEKTLVKGEKLHLD